MNGVTKRNSNLTFDDYICKTKAEQDIKDICINYVDQMPHSKNMIFVGVPGAGKTMLASIMINALDRPLTGAIRTVRQIVKAIDNSRDFAVNYTESDIINGLVDVDLLVIDEIGLQKGNDAEKMMLHDIIDGRYGEMKPTILISNLSGKGVGDSIGDRLESRLKQDLTQLKFTWGDKRL